MSFVDLRGVDVWSDEDISLRVRALIRSRVTADDELKAARLARKSPPTVDDLAYIETVDVAIAEAIEQGRAARADMALLQAALDCEADPTLLDTVSPEVRALVALRVPVAAVDSEVAL